MYGTVKDELATTLREIEEAGLYKRERELSSPQSSHITTARADGVRADALNFCANNYLGLADHPRGRGRRRKGVAGLGIRHGQRAVHLRHAGAAQAAGGRLSDFLQMEDTILYSSCFDANGGVFEVLFGAEDAIISDELNHASIIDGVRLCKAKRFRYKNDDMADLRTQLEAAKEAGARRKVVVTDGVFSMDGFLAPLDQICDLADEFGAMVLVDDCHAVGLRGRRRSRHPRAVRGDGPRRRHHRHAGQGPGRRGRRLQPRTARSSTCCGSGRGPTCSPTPSPPASRPLRSRPWRSPRARRTPGPRLQANSALFRELMTEAGFTLLPASTPSPR